MVRWRVRGKSVFVSERVLCAFVKKHRIIKRLWFHAVFLFHFPLSLYLIFQTTYALVCRPALLRTVSSFPFILCTVISNIKGELCVLWPTSSRIFIQCLCTASHSPYRGSVSYTYCYYFKSFDLIEKYIRKFSHA